MRRSDWKIISYHFKSEWKWAEMAQDIFPAAVSIKVEEFLAYVSNHYILKHRTLET